MKRYIFFIIFFCFTIFLNAQTDKEFWFVAPDITFGHASPGGRPIYLRLNAKDNPSRTCIFMPANPAFDTIWVDIAPNSTQNVDLSAFINDLENFPNDQVNNKGLYIKSTDPSDPSLDGGNISAYYDIDHDYNTDIWALKGENALGKTFYVPFQDFWRNDISTYDPDPLSTIDIVATQDGTTIEITPTNDMVNSSGGVHPAGVTYTITLNKGQTYSGVAAGNQGNEHLGGTKVEVIAGGDIAITIGDDSIRKQGCRDINGDQLIPTNVIGHEYIVMKSDLNTNDGGERAYVMATEDNTDIYIDGVYVTTIDESESYCEVITNNSTHIEGSKPVYLYHIAGYGCEVGGAVLPTIDGCTGSNDVSFVRSPNSTLPRFYLNLMIKTGIDSSHKFFEIIYEDNSTFAIPPDWFEPVPSHPEWYVLKEANKVFPDSKAGGIPTGEVTKIINSKNVFHLGFNNGGTSSTCKYGYFSNYIENLGEAEFVKTSSNLIMPCFGDTIAVHASGGLSYKWYYAGQGSDSSSKYIDDVNVSSPIITPPEGFHKFSVKITHACYEAKKLDITVLMSPEVIADFKIDKPIACAPHTTTITNYSEGVIPGFDGFRWDFDGDGTWDRYTNPSEKTIIPPTYHNTTRSDTTYNVRLLVVNQNSCMDEQIRQVRVYPEINADFSVSDSMGCNPLTVNYTNQSSGDTADFRWFFGDKGTSILTDPSHKFENIGTTDSIYTTTLVTESPYNCTDTAWQDITVFPYIEVDFTLDTATACAAHNAIIYNRSVGVDTFWLNFGDGADTMITNFDNIRHLYENTDTIPYTDTITLIGMNSKGCTDTMQRLINIFPRVDALFDQTPAGGCDSVNIQFTNNSQGYKLTYNWDFGDNTSSAEYNPAHRFFNKTSNTIYDTVILTATSAYYCVDTANIIIPVYPFVKADFSTETVSGCPPLNININNKSINAETYEWDFDGDQIIDSYSDDSIIIPPSYMNLSYDNDTVYPLKLYIENSYGCKDSLTRPITVYPDIEADFIRDKNESCFPARFHYIDQSNGGYSYLWEFGDGATSTKKDTAIHEYEKNMTNSAIKYDVTLNIKGRDNHCADKITKSVEVLSYVESLFSVDKYVGCPPFEVTFENNSIGSNTYQWFINGNPDNAAPNDTAKYINTFSNDTSAANKQYVIALKSTNLFSGCIDTAWDTIEVYPKVTASFDADPDYRGCHPFDVDFINNSIHANAYNWLFGDGSSSSATNPTHIFSNYSTQDTVYNTRLISSSDFCADTVIKKITAFSVPDAKFQTSVSSGCSPLDVSIENRSGNGTVYKWYFGDGESLNKNNENTVNHIYQNTDTISKNYQLMLIAYNTNCRDTFSQNMLIFPQVLANFSATTLGCSPHTNYLNNLSVNANSYKWDFGDGITSNKTSPTHTYIYDGWFDTTYTTKLTATSYYECVDDTTIDISIYPSPVANFAVADSQKYPDTIFVIENQTNDGSWNYYWQYGDGHTSTVKAPESYSYSNWGEYTISLDVYNDYCSDSISRDIIISPPLPIPEFESEGTYNGCEPFDIQFDNQSLYGNAYYWDFGDGFTSIKEDPFHTYYEPGFYRVMLTVVGDGGESYVYKDVTVYRKPEVEFQVTPEIVFLPDEYIQCNNQSRYGDQYLWRFGDGDTSKQENPSHLYTMEGPKDISLIVETENNCMDSLTKNEIVNVKGKGKIAFPTAFKWDPSGPTGGHYDNPDVVKDNLNIFRPIWDGVLEYRLEIYTRWGELIFVSEDIYTGWDGTYRGEPVKQDVYIWKVRCRFSDGKEYIDMGDVTFIR